MTWALYFFQIPLEMDIEEKATNRYLERWSRLLSLISISNFCF